MGATQMGWSRLSGRRPAWRVAAAGSAALLGFALSVTALSVTVLSGTAQAAYPGGNGLIAFVRGGNIYTVSPAHVAGSLERLTSDGRASGPRWSPNGKRIAYVDRGNLWVMNANGSHKKRLTVAAPRYTVSRPTWSLNGRYLAFVRTQRRHSYGYLTRYSFASRTINVFTTTINGHLVRVAARPAPVAWAWAQASDGTHASYLAYEGAGKLCPYANEYCLNLLGFPSQSRYANGFPSAEAAPTKFRLTDPDWFPVNPLYYSNLMTTQETCTAGHCTPVGLDLTVLPPSPSYLGGYQGVYAPTGTGLIAFVRNVRGRAVIYVAGPLAGPARLTGGSQPDWQPVVPARTQHAKGGV